MFDIEIYLNTLYITHQTGYLHLTNQNVVFEHEELGKKTILLHQIQSIVCFGEIMVSPALMNHCNNAGISIIFLDFRGRFRAKIEGSLNNNVLLRLEQYQKYNDVSTHLLITKMFIAGKLQNALRLLNYLAYHLKNEEDKLKLKQAINLHKEYLKALEKAKIVDTVRGIEGICAKIYFDALSYAIRSDCRSDFNMFNGRSKRPPLDRLNALLSFGYVLLAHDCQTAVECVGLDAQVGFLHVPQANRASLALDLMEEFRSILVDHLVIKLINLRKIKASDFEIRVGESVLMNDSARKLFLQEYQNQRKELMLNHPMQKTPVKAGLVPLLQARLFARYVRGDLDCYLPFLREFK